MGNEGEEGRGSWIEEPWFGEGDGGGGDARRFPFHFELKEGAPSGSSGSASDISEILENGV